VKNFFKQKPGRTEATKVTEEKFGTSLRDSLFALSWAGADALEIHLRNFFAYFWRTYFYAAFMIRSRPINDSSSQGG
jgi:hypothetical protein